MNPAFGILVFVLLAIMWLFLTYVVYPFIIEPIIKMSKHEYKFAKKKLDESIDEIVEEIKDEE